MRLLAAAGACMVLVIFTAANLAGYGVGLAAAVHGGQLFVASDTSSTVTADTNREMYRSQNDLIRTSVSDDNLFTSGFPGPEDRPPDLLSYMAAYIDMENLLRREVPRVKDGDAPAIAEAIVTEAYALNIDPWLIFAIIEVESDFRVDAVGGSGEIGLMQPMPATARLVARNHFGIDDFDVDLLYDPRTNIRIAGTHLAYLLERFEGDVVRALTTYNAGRPTSAAGTRYAYRVLGHFDHWDDPAVRIASLRR